MDNVLDELETVAHRPQNLLRMESRAAVFKFAGEGGDVNDDGKSEEDVRQSDADGDGDEIPLSVGMG